MNGLAHSPGNTNEVNLAGRVLQHDFDWPAGLIVPRTPSRNRPRVASWSVNGAVLVQGLSFSAVVPVVKAGVAMRRRTGRNSRRTFP